MSKDKGQTKGKLPSIVLDLAAMVSYLDQNKQPAGPMTAIAAMGRRAKQILELTDQDEPGGKFLGVVLIRDFAERVMKDYQATWNALDALEAGKLVALPKDVQQPTEQPAVDAADGGKGSDDDHPDGNGTDEAEGPSRD